MVKKGKGADGKGQAEAVGPLLAESRTCLSTLRTAPGETRCRAVKG